MSKGYTIQYFINTISNATVATVNNSSVYDVVSPRFGTSSVKAQALESWLGTDADYVADGVGEFSTLGKTRRARVLKALRNRQRFGTVLV
jgi:hypothetical protein